MIMKDEDVEPEHDQDDDEDEDDDGNDNSLTISSTRSHNQTDTLLCSAALFNHLGNLEALSGYTDTV